MFFLLFILSCRNEIPKFSKNKIFKIDRIDTVSVYCECLRLGDDKDPFKNAPCGYVIAVTNQYLLTDSHYKCSLTIDGSNDSLYKFLNNYAEIADNDTLHFGYDLRLVLLLKSNQGIIDTLNLIDKQTLLLNDRYLMRYDKDTRYEILNILGDSLRDICY